MKASAVAHPVQGLVKYHGLRDPALRLPYHDSISVCTAPLQTLTTVEFSTALHEDDYQMNGNTMVKPAERARVQVIVDRLRSLAGSHRRCRLASQNSFPTNIGLGASASAFASITVAAAAALRLELDVATLSRIARLGAGSACRAVVGGYARWTSGMSDDTSYAQQIAGSSDFPLGMVIAVVERIKSTDDAHHEAQTSPFFSARIAYIHDLIEEADAAIRQGELAHILRLAERDTLNLHAVTMSGQGGMLLWAPDTLRVIDVVKQMRDEGVAVWYSIDTGASVYVNTSTEDVPLVHARIRELGLITYECSVGDAAHLVSEHLF